MSKGMPLSRQYSASIIAPYTMPQALVVMGLSPAFCCTLESMLPAEKHKVPSNARPRPYKVSRLAVWLNSSGQNSRPRPTSPKAPPPNTLAAIRWPKKIRALSAFHRVAVENTTAISPLAIHWLAVRKHMKLTQNRQNPGPGTPWARRFIGCRRRVSKRMANRINPARAKR